MKKVIYLMLVIAIMFTTTAFATSLNVQDEPIFDFSVYFTSFTAYVLSILPLTGWIKKAIKIEDQKAKLLSWAVGIALPFIAWKFQLGAFADYSVWWHVAATGVMGAFAANGVFKTTVAQAILALIKAK
ncbi:hypothetical protein [Gelidibacter japonicus]|uniref:hypothetical protein n=1 Tax=Gelidibacter japonicus TaxID=1962232 RepID=UPI002AFEE157|nr:hypothetical protein [Gelidibacter japonicus]